MSGIKNRAFFNLMTGGMHYTPHVKTVQGL
jgi:hypothetical protein